MPGTYVWNQLVLPYTMSGAAIQFYARILTYPDADLSGYIALGGAVVGGPGLPPPPRARAAPQVHRQVPSPRCMLCLTLFQRRRFDMLCHLPLSAVHRSRE
eukprot:1727877-Rhodomonas_salina.2